VDLSAKILIGLVILEYLIVIVVNAAVWQAGGDSGLSMAPFSPEHVFSGIPSNALLFCFAFFIGFEATTIFSEEARNPAKSIPRATYGSVLAIGVFYMITAWLMANAVGVDNLLPTLQGMADPTLLLFDIAGRYLGEPVPTVMGLLFVTSLFAAVLAFHNAVARYIYVGGREGLLPASVGVTHPKHQSPHVGSMIQTVLAVAVVTLFAVLGLDPVLALFTWLTQLGALGVIGLMAVTSFAVVRFFSTRGALGERAHATTILPILSGLVLTVIFVMAYAKFGTMTGASGLLGIALPSLVPVAALVGYLLAVSLSHRDNEQFTSLGSAR
jgi:amino acid transporter